MWTNGKKILFSMLVLTLLLFPRLALADWSIGIGVGDHDRWHDDHHRYGWHDHPHWGYHMHFLPDGYYGIWVGGAQYYYYDGLYYVYQGGDYVLVNPPIGAYVTAIPPDFQPVLINGRTFYTNDGVYYVLTPRGYKVVPGPGMYAQPQQVIVEQPQVTTVVTQEPAPVVQEDSFTINVPNNSGSYTPVVIKRSGSGYSGPQGEYYPTFPSVSQLKAMYGK